MSAKNQWETPELYTGKEILRGLARDYSRAGLKFDDAMRLGHGIMVPWLKSRFEQINQSPYLSPQKERERFSPTPTRLRARLTKKRQVVISPVIERIVAERRFVSVEEAAAIGTDSTSREAEVVQHIYVVAFYSDAGLREYVGSKAGRTSRTTMRLPQLRNKEKGSNGRGFFLPKRYDLVLRLGKISTIRASEIEDQVHAEIYRQGGRLLYGREYFTGLSLDEMKNCAIIAVVSSGITPIVEKQGDT